MGGTVGAHQSGAVEADDHVEPLQGHVVDYLVVGALGERGVDVAEGHESAHGQAGGECHGVLLGYAHVEGAVGHLLHHYVEAAAGRHGRRDAEYPGVALGQLHYGVAEDILKFGRTRPGRCLGKPLAGHHVEALAHGMPRRLVLFGRRESLALDGDDVQNLGAADALEVAQDGGQIDDVVAVDGAEVADVEPLEDVALPADEVLDAVVELGDELVRAAAYAVPAVDGAGGLGAELVVGLRRGNVDQILAHAAGHLVDGHVVVVEHHQHVGVRRGHVVERLKGHAARQRSVANDGHHAAVGLAAQLRGNGHAQCCRHRGGRVPHAKGVVGAFEDIGESADAVIFTIGHKGVAPAGQNLVPVGLMAHVPDELVVGRVEHIVQSHRQLDHAEARPEVPGVAREGVDDEAAQLIAHLRKLLDVEFLQIVGRVDVVQYV